MELRHPVIITPRLQPGVCVRQGDEIAFVSIGYSKQPGDEGRTRYEYHIDLPGGESYSASDLQSGAMGGDLQSGLESLLDFLSNAAEEYGGCMRRNQPYDGSFPANVAEWAYQVSDQLDMLRMDLEEMDGTLGELAIVE